MEPDRLRWTDSRLDDRFETITGDLRSLRDVPQKLAEMGGDVRRVQSDASACHEAVRNLREDVAEYIDEQRKTHEAHRIERKTDRRWMIGTALTAAGLVIAAMALLIGHIG